MDVKLSDDIIKKVKEKQKQIELTNKVDYIYAKGGQLYLSTEFKRRTIKEYAEYYNCKIFVETGTFLGDTTDYLKNEFEELHTIELSEDLYTKARERFKEQKKIICYQGDSKNVLPNILSKINKKVLYWLDAHYSEGITAKSDLNTPILQELKIIFDSNVDGVILIDDAREFGTEDDYPSIFKLKCFIKEHCPQAEIEIYQDIIRIVK